jgi:predicted DsbA family dithiol-disulfide isomerase
MTTEEQMKDLQRRVKTLATNRDQIIREVGSQEQKLAEMYTQLEATGVEKPADLSDVDLQTLATTLEAQLATQLAEITGKLEEGEKLFAQYQEQR